MTASNLSRRQPRQLQAMITRDPDWLRQAQALRYAVFSAEYEADLGASEPGIDADAYDRWCDHLVILDQASGEPVATTRILHQDEARQAGGFYSSGEFDLDPLLANPGRFAEMGRTCVHPDYRNGATIGMLWAAVADYLIRERMDFMIGCASISMADGGLRAWRIARQLQETHLTEPGFRVTPRRAMPHLASPADTPAAAEAIPPLLKAYMRLGAQVCGEPCWDPDFRCADLLVLLRMDRLNARYARHFFGQRA